MRKLAITALAASVLSGCAHRPPEPANDLSTWNKVVSGGYSLPSHTNDKATLYIQPNVGLAYLYVDGIKCIEFPTPRLVSIDVTFIGKGQEQWFFEESCIGGDAVMAAPLRYEDSKNLLRAIQDKAFIHFYSSTGTYVSAFNTGGTNNAAN